MEGNGFEISKSYVKSNVYSRKVKSISNRDELESVLLLGDMLKSKFGLDIHLDIEDYSDDDELEYYEIKFDVPL